MNRRSIGALTLCFGLVLLVAAPGAIGRRVAGSAAPLPISGPPEVGSCVTALVADADRPLAYAPTARAPTAGAPTVGTPTAGAPAQRLEANSAAVGRMSVVVGSCSGVVVGEVTSIDESGRQPASSRVAEDPALDDCAVAEQRYLGWPTAPVDGLAVGRPTVPLTAHSLAIGPDRRQAAMGQRWSGCLLVLDVPGGYSGSARAALDGGRLPAAFGWCQHEQAPDPSILGDPAAPDFIRCDRPHAFEILADLAGLPTLRNAWERCAAVVALVMRRPDPTGGGALRIGFVASTLWTTQPLADAEVPRTAARDPDGKSPAGYAAQGRMAYLVNCYVTPVGPGRLAGTLIGIGGADLPLG